MEFGPIFQIVSYHFAASCDLFGTKSVSSLNMTMYEINSIKLSNNHLLRPEVCNFIATNIMMILAGSINLNVSSLLIGVAWSVWL